MTKMEVFFWIVFVLNVLAGLAPVTEKMRLRRGLSKLDVENVRNHHEKIMAAMLIAALFYYH